MALLYNVVAYIWHLRKYFFESSGANPGSIPKNFIDLSNSWSVASYIYDPLHPTPHLLKKTATITRTTTTNQIVRVTLLENFPTHFVSAFFLTLTLLRFCILSGFLGFCVIFIANPYIEQLTIYPADAQPGDCISISWKHHILKWGD